LIKLSQCSTKPEKIYFEAVRGIYVYPKCTREKWIHYWRTEEREDCPLTQNPLPLKDYNNYEPHKSKYTTVPHIADMQVDASYGGDKSHMKSVTGMIARITGGNILYTTKFQDVIALNSTKAEFIAAYDSGKSCLYI